MNKINKDLLSKKEKEYKLSFDYKSVTYNTTFYKYYIDKNFEKNPFKKNMLEYHIGFERDEGECAFLGYVPEDELFYISLIVSKSREGKHPKCFNPSIPEKGAMDLLVHLCICLSYFINPNFKKFSLYDMAVIMRNEDYLKDKPLSWVKYFKSYSETSYSKYGFFIREDELNLIDSEEGYTLFKEYMRILKNFIQEKRLIDILEDKEMLEILGKENVDKLKNLTLENLLKTIIEDENLTYIYTKLMKNKKIGSMINIQGDYYLSKYYYENIINLEDKVSNVNIKN
jgi:hypothetical protein